MAETAHNRARTVSGAKVGTGAAGMAGHEDGVSIIRMPALPGQCANKRNTGSAT
jgi:hypothetical protein